MRIILFFFLLSFLQLVEAQSFSFSSIPYSDADLNAPARGVEQWHAANEVNVPFSNINSPRLDKYYRFSWNHFESGQGVYTWSAFDQQINQAIDQRQKFSFGVMTCCPGCETGWNINFGGGSSAYPLYLHNLMQSEGVTDWKTADNDWVPNWNSEAYLTRLLALNQAINAHIDNTTYKGFRYRDVINYIDIRGYGAWGEWHSGGGIVKNDVSEYPAGTRATVASLKRIVDIHTTSYANYPLVAMIAGFDANYLGIIMNPPEIAWYLLTQRNSWGYIGWRRDSWGATDSYLSALLENNTRSFGGMRFDTAILNRYKYAPIVGEPPGWIVTYNELESQVRLYHVTSFGNGNYGGASIASISNNIRASSKASGYRIITTGGNVTATNRILITMLWQNIGIAPIYENWKVTYELKDASGQLKWSGNSSFNLRGFLPNANAVPFTDTWQLPPGLQPGTYNLTMTVKDPSGYRDPLPLAITGRNADGSYFIRQVIVNAILTPVTWDYFRYNEPADQWEWQTQSEQDVAYFFIEVSEDGGTSWKRIAIIPSKAEGGNSATAIQYTYKP